MNTLCINYPNDYNTSIKYFENHSFIDKSKSLEYPLTNALTTIFNITNINYLSHKNVLPNWGKLRIGGVSQGGSSCYSIFKNL